MKINSLNGNEVMHKIRAEFSQKNIAVFQFDTCDMDRRLLTQS